VKKILVVQSESLLLDVFRKVLKRGYHVTGTTTPEGALDAFRADRSIDLLITDVVLPVVSGMELAALLRAWKPGLRILLTAETPACYWSEKQTAEFHQLPSNSVVILEKPFYPDDLRTHVRCLAGVPETAVEEVAAPVG
jgi:CheY-like chemotaxis protein